MSKSHYIVFEVSVHPDRGLTPGGHVWQLEHATLTDTFQVDMYI
jgi:hypothetical protein